MASFKLNFADILDIDPAPVSCMNLNHKTKKLALFRGGNVGHIEIWDVSQQPYLEKVILDMETIEDKPSVESIIWVGDRLFSCGLHGFVVEHDTASGEIKCKSAATSGPVWCLAVNQEEGIIAAGTEDGFVNLFRIDDHGLTYLKVLDRQEGRVLCLHWSPCGKYIATGSIDSVRLWDVEKGHAVQRLTTGRSKNKETIVWSVLILDGFTIVSGDSRGIISFWDGRIGVLKFKIQSHKADVLTLRLSKDKTCIYAAGVDPLILILTKMGGNDKWVKSHPRSIHCNDVLCLETYGNRLFSGGIDADLAMSCFPPKIVVKFPPFPRMPYIFASRDSKSVLVKQTKGITLWNLPSEQSELTKVLQLSSKKQESIFSAGLSPNGKVFGYSTLNSLTFFRIDYGSTSSEKKIPVLQKFHLTDSMDEAKHDINWGRMQNLVFIKDNIVALVSGSGRSISFLKINCDTLTVNRENQTDVDLPDCSLGVGIISVSPSGSHICLSFEAKIIVYTVHPNFTISKCCSVPTHSAQPTVAQFHPKKPYILTAYSDHMVQIFDYKEGKILFQEIVKKKFDDLYPFVGAVWSPNGKWAVLYQVDSLFMLEMNADEEPQIKLRKGATTTETPVDGRFTFSLKSCETKYKYLAYVECFNDGQEILAVEVNPNSLLEKLPPAFVKKRFGT